jgi:rhomboid family GlyGly-CTERM serine protease
MITICLALASGLLFCGDGGALLQYDRAAIATGEFWRLVSGHLSHWSGDHFQWCALVFVLAGGLAESLNRRGYLLTLLAAALLIPAATWLLLPDMAYYRGLSGLASGFFVFAATLLARAKYADKEWGWYGFFVCLALLFLSKLGFEALTGQAIFVEAAGKFTPVPLVHLIGGSIGAVIAFFSQPRKAGDGPVSISNSAPSPAIASMIP